MGSVGVSDRVTGSGSASDAPDVEQTLAVSPGAAPDEHVHVAAGDVISRYVVLSVVGEGGMGAVASAYDPQLDRKLAIKFLKANRTSAANRERMIREAQALARLSHPNVVTVHDVGEYEGRLFIAMEFVAGRTLKVWIDENEPHWRDVLRVFTEAGRGLAAAHAAGLIHRDFKLDNVMLGDDGRVRVMDFGLARVDAVEDTTTDGATDPLRVSSERHDPGLTAAGSVMGTPSYMAPEQFMSKELDARTDQFGFCVSLYIAVYGQRPFAGESVRELSSAVCHGRLRPPPAGHRVPKWVWAVLERGLSLRPSDRFASIDELLQALDRNDARRRRWVVAVATATVAASVWGFGVSASQPSPCSGAEQHLAGVWDEEAKANAENAMRNIGRSYADDVWARTRDHLGAYAQQWVEMRTEACAATTIHGEQSTEVLDLRMACLDGALTELDALVDVLEEADTTVVERAHNLVDDLRPLSRCADVATLRLGVEPPRAADADAVETIREHLATLEAQGEAARHDSAQAHLDAADALAETVDYAPVQAELELARGKHEERMGRYAEAEAALKEAMRLAAATGQWKAMTGATSSLVSLRGRRLERGEAALEYADLLLGLVENDPVGKGHAHNAIGAAHQAAGRPEVAEEEFRRAVALLEDALGPDAVAVAGMRNNLALSLMVQNRLEDAEAIQRDVLEQWRRILGDAHPTVAVAHNNLSIMLRLQRKFEEAEAQQRKALEIRQNALVPGHPDIASAIDNVAIILRQRGKVEESIAEHRRALSMIIEAVGDDHPTVARTHLNLSVALQDQQRLDEAEEHIEAALGIMEAALSPEHHELQTAYENLARLRFSQAKAAWPSDRQRAHGLAEESLSLVANSKDAEAEDNAQEVRRWLDQHPLPAQPVAP